MSNSSITNAGISAYVDRRSWPDASGQVIETIDQIMDAASKRFGDLCLTNSKVYFSAHFSGEGSRTRTDWCIWPKSDFFLTEIRQPQTPAWDHRLKNIQGLQLLDYNTHNGGRYKLKVLPACGPDAILAIVDLASEALLRKAPMHADGFLGAEEEAQCSQEALESAVQHTSVAEPKDEQAARLIIEEGSSMERTEDFSDMPLTAVLSEWMKGEEWQDRISTNDDRTAAQVETKFIIKGQPHRMFLETGEKSERFAVFLYSSFNVPPARIGDMSRILNRLNYNLSLGRLSCLDDEDSNPVQFKAEIDVEGSTLALNQISVMVTTAAQYLDVFGELLAAVALTRQPVETLWSNFLEEQERGEEEKQEEGPNEL